MFNARLLLISSLGKILIVLLLLIAKQSAISAEAKKVIKVGVYQNRPKVFVNEAGEASGFFPQLLNEIAKQEAWTIQYMHCQWENCLSKLERGNLDLMIDVAYSPQREQRFDFNQEAVFITRSFFYTTKSVTLNSISELDHQKIAVLDGSIQEDQLRDRAQELGINPIWFEASDFKTLFQKLDDEQVEIAIANEFVGKRLANQYSNIKQSDLLFSSSPVYFAVPQGENRDLLSTIDQHLVTLKDTPNSVYHQLLNRWLLGIFPISGQFIAEIVLITGSISLIIIITIIIFTNRRLKQELNKRHIAEASLKSNEKTLKQITNTVPGAVYQYQIDSAGKEHFLFISEGIKRLYGFLPKAVMNNPQLMWNVIVPKLRLQLQLKLEYSAKTLTPYQCEFEVKLPNEQRKWIKGEAIPQKTDNGTIWNGILVDISQQKWQEQLLATQQQVLENLAKGENIELILTQLISLVEQQTTELIASVLLLEGNRLWHYGKSQLPTEYIKAINGIKIGELQGSFGAAFARGEPVITTDIDTDPLWESYREIAQTYHFKSCWSVPIFSSMQTVLGAFSLYSRMARTPYPWEEELIDIASKLAELALERKQQEEALQKQTQQEQLLSRITGQIRRSLNLQTVLDSTVQEVRDFLTTDRVLLYGLWENSGRVIAESVETGWTSLLAKNLYDPCLSEVTASRLYFLDYIQNISDVDQDVNLQPCYRQMLREYEVKANLVIPIFQNQQIWGFLIAQECANSRQWQPEEIEMLQKLSEQVAIAIQQAELYQQSQTELRQREKLATQLRHKAMHDGLTQLPNRHLLKDRLHYIFQVYRQREKQSQSYFALLFLDLNDFKMINDRLGHDAGDQVLITIAKRLQDCLREKDTVSRLGGDEFVVILEGIHTQDDAIEVANRIHEAFAPPTEVYGEQIHLSTSIGIVLNHQRYVDATQMLRDADTAMYEAKQNQLPYVVFNP